MDHERIIKDLHLYLTKNIDPVKSDLWSLLITEDVISLQQQSSICEVEKTNSQQVRSLLSVLTKKSRENFEKFITCLITCDHKHVADKIQGWRQKSEKADKRIPLTTENYATVAEEIKQRAPKPPGEPVPIITWSQSGVGAQQITWLHDNMVTVFDKIQDKPVVICSVVGACRTGKSFLLNLMIRELEKMCKDSSFPYEEEAVVGFEWTQGVTRTTTGILIWSEPYSIRLKNGQEVAVLIMDTHGMFDQETPMEVSSLLVTLSIMISSIQIFNVKDQILEDQLKTLELVTTAATLAVEGDNPISPLLFQRLIFLVRDWIDPAKYQYGAQGGAEYLKGKLNVGVEKLSDTRKNIKGSFDELQCFLLPHPGKLPTVSPSQTILKKMEEPFTGKLKDVDEEFKEFIPKLTDFIFKTNLDTCVKQISGEEMKGRDVLFHIRKCVSLFQNGKLPTPEDTSAVLLNHYNGEISKKCIMIFKEKLSQISSVKSVQELREKLQGLKERGLEMFDTRKKAKEENSKVQREELDNALFRLESEVLDMAKAATDEKTAKIEAASQKVEEMYKNKMHECCSFEKKGTQDVQLCHEETVKAVMSIFEQDTKGIERELIEKRTKELCGHLEGEVVIVKEIDRLKRQDAGLSSSEVQRLSCRKSARDAELSSNGETRKIASRIAIALAADADRPEVVAAIVTVSGFAIVALGCVAAAVVYNKINSDV